MIDGTQTTLELKTSTGTPEVWSLVGTLISVSGPNSEVASIAQPQLGGTFKEFRPSSKPDSGTVDIVLYTDFDNEVQQDIRDLARDTPAIKDWRVTYADSTSQTFSGFVTSYSQSGSEEDQDLQTSVSIKLTGGIIEA